MKKLLTTLLTASTLFGVCQNNYSLQFDGINGTPAGVEISNSNTLMNFGVNNFTISHWFRSNAALTGHFANSVGKFGTGNNYYDITPRRTNTGNCVFHFANGDGQDYYAEGATSIDDGNWHYLTGVREGDFIHLYIDGVLQNSTSLPSGANADNSGNVKFQPTDGNNQVSLMDNVEIWSKALTQEEIEQYMNCPPTGSESNLVGFWNFEEGSGSVTNDLSPNGNAGNFYNGTAWVSGGPISNCSGELCVIANYPFNGNADDGSGNGNNGTVNGATLTVDRFGNSNGAYSFDGVDDNIVVTDNNIVDFDGTTSFTITTWVKTSGDFAGLTGIVAKMNDNSAAPNIIGWQQGLSNNEVAVFAHDNSGTAGSSSEVFGTTSLADNEWHQIITILDRNASLIKIYIDNTLQKSTSISLSNIDLTNTADMYFGVDRTISNFYSGIIDDIKIYNCALNDDQINAIYQAESPVIVDCSSSTLASSANSTDIICFGANDGTAEVIATGGNTPYSYLWSNGNTSSQISSLSEGNYTVTISDATSCTNIVVATISEPNLLPEESDTATYVVDDLAFVTISPVIYFDSTEYLSNINGCDSIHHHYSKFVYSATYCTDTNYVSVTDTLFIDVALGISPNNSINTVKVYPNPTSTHIYINNGDYANMGGYSIRIENSLGQSVFEQDITQQEFFIDLSGWTGNGMYFVHIIDLSDNTIDIRKIVLN